MAKDPVSQTMSIAMMADIKRRGGSMSKENMRKLLDHMDIAQSDLRNAQREAWEANQRVLSDKRDLVMLLINDNLIHMLNPDMTQIKRYLRERPARPGEKLIDDIVTDENKR